MSSTALVRLPLLVLLLAVPAPRAAATGASGATLAALAAHPHVTDELLVQFQRGLAEVQKAAVAARVSALRAELVVSSAWRWDGKGDLELLRLAGDVDVAGAIAALAGEPGVEFAEPNWLCTHDAVSDDPRYLDGSLWGMYGDATSPANPYGSQAGEAWALGSVGSAEVYVGVIDEGVMVEHEDLLGQVWTNPFDPVNGLDDDGNGFVDDLHGWDFDGDDATVYDGTVDEHGTHVAGIIGARGGNGAGVAGLAWNVTMIPAKFLGKHGGTIVNAVKAVDYLTDLRLRHGLRIVASNNSWTGGGYSQSLVEAIDRGGDAGILFVAAAGNGGSDGIGDDNDLVNAYPSNYACTNGGTRGWDCIVAVAAITSSGVKASFSNYGATTVDLGAPGSLVWSTLPYLPGGVPSYGPLSGTSMATPHVSGAAALYAASHPLATAEEVRAALLSSALPTPSLSGLTVTGGRLDASGF